MERLDGAGSVWRWDLEGCQWQQYDHDTRLSARQDGGGAVHLLCCRRTGMLPGFAGALEALECGLLRATGDTPGAFTSPEPGVHGGRREGHANGSLPEISHGTSGYINKRKRALEEEEVIDLTD